MLYFLRELGFDPTKFWSAFRNIPGFLLDYYRFRRIYSSALPIVFSPNFSNKKENAGVASGHYFWQDLLCAQWVKRDKAGTHLDLGSRIDGFIAHISIFCEVTLLDIRPLNSNIPNVNFELCDILKLGPAEHAKFHTVSSLHSIEHFGLGRYGDPILENGHEVGLRNLAEYVELGGFLYLSFPVGEPRVEFNSQRVLDPNWPLQILKNFSLEEFVLIPWNGPPQYNHSPDGVDPTIVGQAGLYCFKKIAN